MKNRQKCYRKILRAYTGWCVCENVGGTCYTPDGRTSNIHRKCPVCGRVIVLLRDPGRDKPLVSFRASNRPPLRTEA